MLLSTKTKVISPNFPETFPLPIPCTSLLSERTPPILFLFQTEFGIMEIGLPVSTSALYFFVQPSVVCNWTEAVSLVRRTTIPRSIKSKSICVSNSSSMTVDTDSLFGKVYGKFIPTGFFCTHFFHLGWNSGFGFWVDGIVGSWVMGDQNMSFTMKGLKG